LRPTFSPSDEENPALLFAFSAIDRAPVNL